MFNSILLEELKKFLDGTETYRSLEARLVTTASLVSLGAVEEPFQKGAHTQEQKLSDKPAFGLWSSSC